MRQKVDFPRCFSPWAKTTCPPPPRTQANLLPKSVLLFFPCCWVFPRLSSRNDWRLAWLANLCPPRSPSCMCLGAFGGFHLQIPVHTTSLHLPTDLCVTPFGFLYLSVEFRAYRSFLRMALLLPVPALILLPGLLVEPLPRSLGAVVTTSGRRLAATPLCCSGACLPWASSDHPVFPSPFSVSAPPFQL